MLFHVTVTHTADECPGYNHEKMPDLVSRWEGREATLTQHGVKLHFMVEGLPEHIAFALLEADCPAAVAMVLVDLLPYRADFKVTPVVHADELVAGLKEKLP